MICRALTFGSHSKLSVMTYNHFIPIGWGSHFKNYPHPYLTASATIGMRKEDVDLFVQRLDKCLEKFKCNKTLKATPGLEEDKYIVNLKIEETKTVDGSVK